jgi:hypothetical protein
MDSSDIASKDTSGTLLASCYLNDIRVLDIGRLQWSRLRTHGSPPTGRFGHTLVLSEDDAVVFGGWSGTAKVAPGVLFSLRDKVNSDTAPQGQADARQEVEDSCEYCMTLRTSDMQWVNNKFIGVPASKRYGHTATAIGPHLIIIGGWDGGKPLSDVIVLRDRTVAETGGEEDQGLMAEGGDQIFEDDGFAEVGADEDFAFETGEN